CLCGGIYRHFSPAVEEIMTVQVPFVGQRGQRRIDGARLDVRPFLDVPGDQFSADLVTVDGLESAHGAHHQQTGGCNGHTWSLNMIERSARSNRARRLSASETCRSPAPAPPRPG